MMPKLNVSITGHTSGIGLDLHQKLSALGHSVLGFSRSNGFDLAEPNSIPRIINAAEGCSVFINNAHRDWAQVDLLYALFKAWEHRPTRIINIGSNSGDGTKNFAHPYAAVKTALDKAAEQLNNVPGSQCRIVTLRPGWVRTPRVQGLTENPMLDAQDITQVILWILSLPAHMHIPSITMEAKCSPNR